MALWAQGTELLLLRECPTRTLGQIRLLGLSAGSSSYLLGV